MAAALTTTPSVRGQMMATGMGAGGGLGAGGGGRAAAKAATCGTAAAMCAEAAGCGVVHCSGDITEDTVEIFNYKQGGEYQAVIEYKYVGEGAGDFTKIEVVSNVSGSWSCWGFFGGFILIGFCALCYCFISTDTTTTTMTMTMPPMTTTFPTPPPQPITSTTPMPTPATKRCVIFGDPHVLSFDGYHGDFYQSGIWPLVKAPTIGVIIQGLFLPTHATNGLSVLKKVGVGGRFLQGNKLLIGVEHAFWNTQPILTTFPSSFMCPGGLCQITYNSQGKILQPGRENKAMKVIHVTFSNGVKMQINRWDLPSEGRYMNVEILMPATSPVFGLCGNMNGIMEDDHRRAIFSQVGTTGVPPAEALIEGGPYPINNEIATCPDATLMSAHDSCKAASGEFWPHMSCLEAVCKGSTAAAWKSGGAMVA